MSDVETLAVKVKALEDRQDKLDRHYESIISKMDGIVEQLHELAKALAVSKAMVCPAPGSCVPLAARVTAMETTVKILNDLRLRGEGAVAGSRWTLLAIWGLLATCVVAVGNWLAQHLHFTTK